LRIRFIQMCPFRTYTKELTETQNQLALFYSSNILSLHQFYGNDYAGDVAHFVRVHRAIRFNFQIDFLGITRLSIPVFIYRTITVTETSSSLFSGAKSIGNTVYPFGIAALTCILVVLLCNHPHFGVCLISILYVMLPEALPSSG